ncbi:MAG: glycerol-3-phosphate 1-O-acyltransferase PlsY [Verrucomicrobiota bacterium]
MELAIYSVVVLLSYLLGSIPTGYLAGRLQGVDIRAVGSGNIGATNVFRALGKTAGFTVLAIDALKGFAACRWVPLLFGAPVPEDMTIAAGVAAILGHNYTCWLRFKGGKGIATSAGVLLGWLPWALAIVLGLWGIVFGVSRYVSLASITAALALPLAAWVTGGSPRMIGIAAMVGALAIYKHHSNIRRLINGTEHRFGATKQPVSTEPTS